MRRYLPLQANLVAVDVQSNGTLSVIVPPLQYDCFIMSIALTGPARSICYLYAGAPGGPNQIDRSLDAQHDHADYTGKYLPGGTSILGLWYSIAPPNWVGNPGKITGSAPGSATILVEVDDHR